MKTKLTPQARKDAVAQMRKFHELTFTELNNPDAIYIPKMAHYVSGSEGLHMGFLKQK